MDILNIRVEFHKEFGYSYIIDNETNTEIELDFEWHPCSCGYPARLISVSCYYENYKCDKCKQSFSVN